MDTIIATLKAIARLAPDADRETLATLGDRTDALDRAAKAALALGTMDDETIAATGEAHAAALTSIADATDAVVARAAAMILALPADRATRASLRPMMSNEQARSRLRNVGDRLTVLVRDDGTPMHLLRDGVRVGAMDAYDVTIFGDRLALGAYGEDPEHEWPMDDVIAVGIEDEGFGILLADGALLEIVEDADFAPVGVANSAAA